jgi:WhiB family redox-sensing transcriptional regulator
MTNRHLSDTKYFALLRSIREADGVECEKYPDAFFPEDIDDPDKRAASVKLAKALCNACPIKDECFTYAIETNQRYGVWGGTLGHER